MSETIPVTPYGDSARPEMQSYVPPLSSRVLEVGCHTGAFGKALKQDGVATVWGVEANPETAAVAAQRLDKVLVGYFGPGQDLPEAYFDVIVFNDVLEHMSDPAGALQFARSRLAPGGVVVASIPNLRHFDNLMHILIDKDFRYERNGVRDATHLRFYTLKSIPRLFEESGYTVQRLEGIHEDWWTPSLLRRAAFRLFPAYLADTRYMQYAVVATPRLPS